MVSVLETSPGAFVGESNWEIERKAFTALVDKLKGRIALCEEQALNERSKLKREIGNLRRTLEDTHKRYEFEISTI